MTGFSYKRAHEVLLEALETAKSNNAVPVEWISFSRSVFGLSAKTWTPALATMLLAKATDGSIDSMSLKVDPANPASFSARGLCHKIIVPAAVDHGFSIRNTGREPMNNQPFFRYARIDELERVREPSDRDFFVDVAQKVNDLDSASATQALDAFLRVSIEAFARVRQVAVKSDGLSPDGARIAAVDFLRRDAPDRPQRLQAFAAACLDLVFTEVLTRRIHDPSRDFPGDVHVADQGVVTLAMEVRGKPVTQSDLQSFARAVHGASINRAVLFVDSSHQEPLDTAQAARSIEGKYLHVATFMSVTELLGAVILWSEASDESVAKTFTEAMLARLKSIEVAPASLEEWVRAVAVARGL